MEEIFTNWEDCEYCRQSYYERDTGYSEYECELTGFECLEECPLNCKYEIVK